MTTFAELIAEARNHLMSEQPENLNVLDVGVSANAVSLQLRNELRQIDVGARLAIGLEVYQVIATPSSTVPGSSVQVIPAIGGSTSTSHSAGDLVYVNPQFSDFRIGRQVNHCLQSLHSHHLFRIRNVFLDYIPATSGYNLNAFDLIDIWRVSYDVPGPARDWPMLLPGDYHLDQSADTGDFANGKQLVIHQGGYPGHQVKVSYRAMFSPLANLADDVEVVSGLHAGGHDIPPLGAAIRCLYGREVKRSFLTRQPEPRRQEEVPPGAANQSITPLARAYYEAIDRELSFLRRKFPMQILG